VRKFEHWQDPSKGVSHGWVTGEDIKTRDLRTVLIVRAPVGNKIVMDMAGVVRLHQWLGELIEQERRE
jgi:hypothetical protein